MKSVLIIGFDGLQPSQVTPELMPNLARFAARGVFFENHHPVYPSLTRVNVASIATGRYPGNHGIAGNSFVAREFNESRVLPALLPELTELLKETGRFLLCPNLAQAVTGAGKTFVSLGMGSSGNAFIHGFSPDRPGAYTSHPEFSMPDALNVGVEHKYGKWPERQFPDLARLSYGARVMAEHLLPEYSPDVAVFWAGEPDVSQHKTGVSSAMARKGLAEADRAFATLMAYLEKSGKASDTDVIVVSDHGYSQVTDFVDVKRLAADAGFGPEPSKGGVVIAPNNGSVSFYVIGRSRDVADRLAAWLMAQPWCGALIADDSLRIEGAIAASRVAVHGERVPDIMMSFAWDSKPNSAGVPGHAYSCDHVIGEGDHGSMSGHEMRNTLIAAGPSFKSRMRIAMPTGNVDVAPTVLHLLGLAGGEAMDGRVVREAIAGGPSPESIECNTEVVEAGRKQNGLAFSQYVKVTTVGKTVYVDEGNRAGAPA
ncbi:MAG: alkaline phosphatase family protein [SAR202 cluster bacterium]|nr:alkaline phosphatase family protein [SAR202 cluster bacterium]